MGHKESNQTDLQNQLNVEVAFSGPIQRCKVSNINSLHAKVHVGNIVCFLSHSGLPFFFSN